MIVRDRITFVPKPKQAKWIDFKCRFLLRSLADSGYALGSEAAVILEKNGLKVHLIAYFTDKHAWRTACKETGSDLARDFAALREATKGDWQVERLTQSVESPVRACKCKSTERKSLDLWCSPISESPPLVCSKDGVFGVYQLKLHWETWRRLHDWNHITRTLGRAYLDTPGDNPYRSTVFNILSDETGWICREGRSIAKQVSKEIGIRVRAFCPPVHICRS